MSYEQLDTQSKLLHERLRTKTGAALGGLAMMVAGCGIEQSCEPEETEMHVAEPGDGVDTLLKRSNNSFNSTSERYAARDTFHELNPGSEDGLEYLSQYETPICEFK